MRRSLFFQALCLLLFVTSIHAQPRRIVITVDDLPGVSPSAQDTSHARSFRKLADVLRSKGIHAHGFVIEGRMYENGVPRNDLKALLTHWLDAGHDLGNHTYAHPSLHQIPAWRYIQQIDSSDIIIGPMLEARGRRVKYFRHPYLQTGLTLATRDSVTTYLKGHGYEVAPVTIDNADYLFAAAYWKAILAGDEARAWKIGDTYVDYMEAVVDYYERQSVAVVGYELPQILLMHANRLNADYFGRLADRLVKRGYRFIGLDEALKDPAYRLPDTFIRNSGISWLHRWALTQGKRGEFFAGEPEVPAWIDQAAQTN